MIRGPLPMHPLGTKRVRFIALSSIAVVGILLGPISTPALGVRTDGAPPASGDSWAYGGNRSVSASGTAHNGTYALTAAFGYAVVLKETIGSGGVVALAATRTMGAAYQLSYCVPNCQRPVGSAVVSFRALEVMEGFANVTPSATVNEGGAPVPGLGLLDASTYVRLGAWENDSLVAHEPLAIRTGSTNLSLEVNATLHVAFAPPLGLVPLQPSVGDHWDATAAFNATGQWNSTASYLRTPLVGLSTSGRNSQGFSATRTGTVVINGSYIGNLTLSDGTSAAVVGLTVSGPLHFRDGVFLLPAAADLFNAASIPNAPGGNGTLGEAPSALDFVSSGVPHLGLEASATQFTASGRNPSDPSGPVSALAPASEGSGNVAVQAQPESVTSANQNTACLQNDRCLVGGSGDGPSGAAALRPLLGGVAVGLLATVVVLLVVAARRPRVPARLNAELYPPALSDAPAKTPPASRFRSSVPEPEPDPLGHLW